jgi:hypothetical protein
MLRPFLLILCLAAASSAHAETIGLGLDWRSGVYVQEVWHKGAPHYVLANLGKEDVQITVHEFDSRWRLGQPLPEAEAGPWKVAAGGKALVDAAAVTGDKLHRFVIADGKQPLGVLPSVGEPTFGDEAFKGKRYASRLGLNGSGGATPGIYLVQPSLGLRAGSTTEVALYLPAKSGVLKFNLMPEKNADPLRPSTLILDGATSETLPITADAKQITIDTGAPKAEAASHEIILQFKVPKVDAATLFMLDGWLANSSGGGQGLTRGFWVMPESPPGPSPPAPVLLPPFAPRK